MIHVGSRTDPSVKTLVLTVLIIVAASLYLVVSLSTGDWLWFSQRFAETPRALVVYCYGETIDLAPGSYHFSALTKIINDAMSGRKRWDPLTLSQATYHDYQTDPKMMSLEVTYAEPVRIHSTYKYYSSVDNLVIPLDGRHASSNAIFGQNQGVPTAGSLHIDSVGPLTDYLKNQKICTAQARSNK